MKTTIEVSDALFEEAKAMARARGITLRELIEAGLLAVVDKAHHREPVTYRRHTVNGNGLQPGVSEGNWEEIRSLAYGRARRMIGVDTNVLVYAHREDSPFHKQADLVLQDLVEGPRTWSIPWSCLCEFVAIATHPRIYNPPSSIDDALQQVDSWLESPTLLLIGERGSASWDTLRAALREGESSVRGYTTRELQPFARSTA